MNAELETIATALGEAKLLVERRGALPATISGITDDSRAVKPGTLFVAVRGTRKRRTRLSRRGSARRRRRGDRSGSVAHDAPGARRERRQARRGRSRRRPRTGFRRAISSWSASPERTARRPPSTCCAILLADGDVKSASIGTLGVLLGSEGTPLDGGGGLTTPGPIELQRVFRATARPRRASRGDGSVVALAAPAPRGRCVVRRRDVHELHARPPRLPRHDGGVLRREGDAARLPSAAWNGGVEPRRHRLGRAPHRAAARGFQRSACRTRRCTPRTFDSIRAAASSRSGWARSRRTVRLPLIGDFNVINALGAAATAYALGMPADRVAERLSTHAAGAGASRADPRDAGGLERLRAHARRADSCARRGAPIRRRAADRRIRLRRRPR